MKPYKVSNTKAITIQKVLETVLKKWYQYSKDPSVNVDDIYDKLPVEIDVNPSRDNWRDTIVQPDILLNIYKPKRTVLRTALKTLETYVQEGSVKTNIIIYYSENLEFKPI